jgi:glycosyltransferase involved in cell wall biosynthesis
MTRLLFITHCYPQAIDDIRGSFFLPLIQKMLEEGIEVEVLTPMWGGQGGALSRDKGFYGEVVWRFPWSGDRLAGLSLKDPRSLFIFFRFICRWHSALRELQRQKITWGAVVAAWAIPAGLLLRVSVLRQLPSAIWWLGTDFNRFNKIWFVPILKLISTGGCENWSNSHRIIDALFQRVGVLANFVPLANPPVVKATKVMNNNSLPRVLSVGRLEPVKGFDVGIRAALDLMEAGVNFEYRLVGSGSELDKLANIIGSQKKIRLLGFLDNDSLRQEIESADIILIPSRQEGMPLVFFEALSAGKPLVVTDVGDLRRCLNGTNLGLVSISEDVSGMADNLRRALSGEIYFDANEAKNLIDAYSLKHTLEAVRALIAKSEEK